MIKYSKISQRTFRKVIKHFCVDIDATRTSKLINLNRETVNRYFLLFRQAVHWHQNSITEKLFGKVEFDESYFGAKRKRGHHGKLKRGRGTSKQPAFGIF